MVTTGKGPPLRVSVLAAEGLWGAQGPVFGTTFEERAAARGPPEGSGSGKGRVPGATLAAPPRPTRDHGRGGLYPEQPDGLALAVTPGPQQRDCLRTRGSCSSSGHGPHPRPHSAQG